MPFEGKELSWEETLAFSSLFCGNLRKFILCNFLKCEISEIFSVKCLKKIVPRLYGYCGGAVNSIILVFTQVHRSSFNFDFEILFESI